MQSPWYSHPNIFDLTCSPNLPSSSPRSFQLAVLFMLFRTFQSNLHVRTHLTSTCHISSPRGSLMTAQYISKVLNTARPIQYTPALQSRPGHRPGPHAAGYRCPPYRQIERWELNYISGFPATKIFLNTSEGCEFVKVVGNRVIPGHVGYIVILFLLSKNHKRQTYWILVGVGTVTTCDNWSQKENICCQSRLQTWCSLDDVILGVRSVMSRKDLLHAPYLTPLAKN